ncbi:hypothetical protein C7450_102188 [Chelatococcus asaccharovorans]|uniref:Uncharacterized protein n=1 Tax=Chelatococcus asaccharovorans TaxID=28210 RepID=A0A2V3UDC8_9HYPH|nr:hypothetical protein C7450_102188 [Chelatococcus asaccharovorans]
MISLPWSMMPPWKRWMANGRHSGICRLWVWTLGVIPGGAERRKGDPWTILLDVWIPFPASYAGRRG